MQERRYHVILNPKAGTALALGLTCATLSERFEKAGLDFEIDADEETPLDRRIEHAIASDAEIVVAAGGDGTVTAIATALIGTGKTLAVLPLGTMNALGRDLGVPLDLDEAVAALPGLETRAIDVGYVNGRLFLHNVLIGIIPGIAVVREKIREEQRLGAWFGFLSFIVRRLSRARRMAVAIEPDTGNARIERLQAIAVANNSYDQKPGAFLSRKRIDRGSLTLYIVRSLGVLDAVRLTIEMLAGRWREDEAILIEKVRALSIRVKKPNLLVTVDGEVMTLPTPLDFAIGPGALSVLAAPSPAEVAAAAAAPASEAVPA